MESKLTYLKIQIEKQHFVAASFYNVFIGKKSIPFAYNL